MLPPPPPPQLPPLWNTPTRPVYEMMIKSSDGRRRRKRKKKKPTALCVCVMGAQSNWLCPPLPPLSPHQTYTDTSDLHHSIRSRIDKQQRQQRQAMWPALLMMDCIQLHPSIHPHQPLFSAAFHRLQGKTQRHFSFPFSSKRISLPLQQSQQSTRSAVSLYYTGLHQRPHFQNYIEIKTVADGRICIK